MTSKQSSHRLFIDIDLEQGALYNCTVAQNNYLLNVLRLPDGAHVSVFNGKHGEWRAVVRYIGKKKCALVLDEQVKRQFGGPSIHYLFAPLKRGRLDYMVQKATELGVETIKPVITRRTNISRIKEDRLRANIVEAAEQCGILRVPELREVEKLANVLVDWPLDIPLIFCDEEAEIASPLEALSPLKPDGSIGLLIGPEGGFSEDERCLLKEQPFVHAISLGPRIMRADTAAVAALALVNAVLFDWR